MDEKTVVKVENIGKRYRIGIKEEMHENLLSALLGVIKSPIQNYKRHRSLYKFDDIAGGNGEDTEGQEGDIIWALRNVSFDVGRGEKIGIIGRNGSGKSTLLKILSKITSPTVGKAEIRGKVSSLLEVGTGFHQELTGRENIFLNGTILGMKRKEIEKKFDEIVDFSGVERYLDTPVKRYSSGMRVRLAFSVAAHLEPEILIVDEVLAVGDAAFQSKSLGKMNEAAEEGRTVLIVSHNMAAIENLCNRAILLHNGFIKKIGTPEETIALYLSETQGRTDQAVGNRADRKGEGKIKITKIDLRDGKDEVIHHPITGKPLKIRLYYETADGNFLNNCRVSCAISKDKKPLLNLSTELVSKDVLDLNGKGAIEFEILRLPLSESLYLMSTYVESNGVIQDWVIDAAELHVVDGDFYGTGKNYVSGSWKGKTVLVDYEWEKIKTAENDRPTNG